MIVPKRNVKDIKQQRDNLSLNNSKWLLYNSELRFTKLYQSDPNSLETKIWEHIYRHNLKLLTETMKPRWNILSMPDPLPGLDQISSAILINRGITENVSDFILAPLEKLELEMPEIDYASSVIIRAINKKIPITIYGDYDADGITGTALAVEALERIGAKVDYYINDRRKGYAVDEPGIRNIASKGVPRLIITVDNGVSSHEAVNLARKMKMGIIVTDHHEMTERPNAHALIHPRNFNTPLAGVGTVFKLIHYLYRKLGRDDMFDFLDLVAIGTIADLVPLIGENRILVKHGMERLNKFPRPAIQALCQIMKIKKIKSEDIAYKIAPLLNTLSRMNGTADQAVELLLTKDIQRALIIAEHLKELNEKRKGLVEEETEKAEELVDPTANVLILCSDFHEGVAGIIAGRLKEKYNRPVIVLCDNGDYLKGSCRSIKGLNIKRILDGYPDLENYGGHALAAGLTIKKKNYADFCSYIFESLKDHKPKPPVIEVDAKLDTLSPDMVNSIELLEPYGESFPPPLFAYECRVKHYKSVNDEHLKIMGRFDCIVWNAYKKFIKDKPSKMLLFGVPSIDTYNNRVQFIARDYKEI